MTARWRALRSGATSSQDSAHGHSSAMRLRTVLLGLVLITWHLPVSLNSSLSVHGLLWDLWPLTLPCSASPALPGSASTRPWYLTRPDLIEHLPSLFPLIFCQFQFWLFTTICFLFSSCWNVEPCWILKKQLTESSTNLTQLSSNSYQALGTGSSVPDIVLSMFSFNIHNNHEGRICIPTLPVETEA